MDMNFTEGAVFEQMGRLYMANTMLNRTMMQIVKEKEVEKVKTKELEEEIKQLEQKFKKITEGVKP